MTTDRIIQIVCEAYNTTPEEIKIMTAHRVRAEVRHMAAYVIKEQTGLPKKQIDALLNYKRYGARYAIRNIKVLLEVDRATQGRYRAINEKIEAYGLHGKI